MTDEHPILFSAPMVRAILDGRKTQTRRVVKPYEWFEGHRIHSCMGPLKPGEPSSYETLISSRDGGIQRRCPYGSPGDRLWVKETWRADDYDPKNPKRTIYVADVPEDVIRETKGIIKSRPSIFMPRNRSRITLEITGVRVERLQEITLGEVCKEGLADSIYDFKPATAGLDAWRTLWESINGAGSWAANPFVWVISFAKISNT